MNYFGIWSVEIFNSDFDWWLGKFAIINFIVYRFLMDILII